MTPRLRHHLALYGLGALFGLVIAVSYYDWVTVASDHQAKTTLTATAQRLHDARATTSLTGKRIASAIATRNSRMEQTSRESDEIGTTEQRLASSQQTAYFQSLDLATLQTCLSGVSTAVTAISSADLQGAVNSITAASSACESLDGSNGGLIYPFDFPDPFILPVGSSYYAFATNAAAGNIQIITSPDLVHWTTVGDALPHLAAWAAPGATWAPSVLQRDGTFVLYYSALDGVTGEQCISEAVASQPQGPYVDSSKTPLVCQLALGGSMDPSPFVGADGSAYLTWKSQGANGQPATLWSQQLDLAGTALAAGSPSALLTPSQSWQGGIVEGPDMVVSGGDYLLYYSANAWQTANYAIGVVACTGPLGPCAPGSGQPLLASGPAFSGPGGPSVFTDAQGNPWMAFAAWLPGKVGFPNSRPLFHIRIANDGGVVQPGL